MIEKITVTITLDKQDLDDLVQYLRRDAELLAGWRKMRLTTDEERAEYGERIELTRKAIHKIETVAHVEKVDYQS